MTAIASTSASRTPASAQARSTVGTIASRCARLATSGTTPPNRACSSTLDATASASSVWPRTMPTPVSSQDVSMPSTSGCVSHPTTRPAIAAANRSAEAVPPVPSWIRNIDGSVSSSSSRVGLPSGAGHQVDPGVDAGPRAPPAPAAASASSTCSAASRSAVDGSRGSIVSGLVRAGDQLHRRREQRSLAHRVAEVAGEEEQRRLAVRCRPGSGRAAPSRCGRRRAGRPRARRPARRGHRPGSGWCPASPPTRPASRRTRPTSGTTKASPGSSQSVGTTGSPASLQRAQVGLVGVPGQHVGGVGEAS